jgi:oxygen-independent coproporphyrinogen-3 oxidase
MTTIAVQSSDAAAAAGDGAPSLALYLHIPFCSAKCGYCDFNSYEHLDHLVPAYTPALVSEIGLWAPAAQRHRVTSVFFGGGTPSLTSLEDLEAIIGAVRERFAVDAEAEWTLEANPTELTQEHLVGMRALGINRLSMGAQSMHADELELLDRQHSPEQVTAAVAAARAAGFDNLNLDLIFGLINHTEERWRDTLEQVLALQPEHLSCYALTVEPETALYYRVQKGILPEPDPDVAASQYEWTRERLAEAGYEHYEISNWAQPRRRCEHNLVYWRGEPYLGMGAGAHSFFVGQRFANLDAPNRYVEAITASVEERAARGRGTLHQVAAGETPDAATNRTDVAILGLRLLEGIDEADFEARFGTTLDAEFGAALEKHERLGLIERGEGRVRLTERGLLLSNEVFIDLLPDEPAGESSRPEADPAKDRDAGSGASGAGA